jgi:hypothetical protein
MGKATATACAYCGHSLQLSAGFCSHCHAPVKIAQSKHLVANTRRLAVQKASSTALAIIPVVDSVDLPRHKLPRKFYLLAAFGIVMLLLTVTLIILHTTNTFTPHMPDAALSASLTPDGSPVSTIFVEQTIYMTLAVPLDHDSTVTLDFQIQGQIARQFAERWPAGDIHRTLSLTPLTPGQWIFTLNVDDRTIQTLHLTVMTGSAG